MPVLTAYYPAIISGLMMTAAFPDTRISLLAWVALVPLLVSINTMPPRQAFYAGLITGMTHFLTLIYWIIPTIHDFGGIPIVLAGPVLFILCLYLALYTAIFAWFLTRFHGHPWTMPLRAALLWAGLEYLRSILFTGFPWGLLGYSQYQQTRLIQIADTTGVFGISFILVLSSAVVAWGISAARQSRERERPLPLAGLAAWACVLLGTVALTVIHGTRALTSIDQALQSTPTASVGVVQGNINQAHKWEASWQTMTVDRYCRLSLSLAGQHPDLVVWPETAMPFYYSWDRELSGSVDACIRRAGTSFLFGSPAFKGDETAYEIYNRAYMVNRFSIVTGTYDKTHLVPFGEYVPFGRYLTFLGKLTAQAGDFAAGSENVPPLEFGAYSAGVLICFESIFPPLARNSVNQGAELLIIMTNDAWFGRTSAPLQHFAMAVFRAVENRRSVIRAANTGISGFIDPGGRILATTSLFKADAITRRMACLTTTTPYTRHGDLFALICLGLCIPACWICRTENRTSIPVKH